MTNSLRYIFTSTILTEGYDSSWIGRGMDVCVKLLQNVKKENAESFVDVKK